MPFKFDAHLVFLTYPHSSFDHGQFNEWLQTVCPTSWCRVASEIHEGGEPHIHAVAKFIRRFQSRNERIFDYNGRHPNIQPVRSTAKSLDYLTKDGQFTDFGTIPTMGPKRGYAEALSLAGEADEAEYLRACLEARMPFQYAKRFRELAFSDNTCVIASSYESHEHWECASLQQTALPENTCAVLVGPSGCGKSAWAKRNAPKPALWVSHMDVLRMFKPGYHKSIIFDDMSFSHMPLQAQIHLVDWTDARQIHCRYGYATIPAGTIKIFTCNEDPFSIHAAISRRTTYIRL